MLKRTFGFLITTTIFLLTIVNLYAHDFWIENEGDKFGVVYGHGKKRIDYEPIKVKNIKAFDVNSKELDVSKETGKNGLILKPIGHPSVIFIEIDDGYWSKTIYGWKNVPKREAKRVVESIRSFYFCKVILSWSDIAQKPLTELEIILLKNPFEMKAGNLLPIKVLYHGRQLGGVEIEGGDHKKVTTADRDGGADIQLSKGLNLITVRYKEPIPNNPDADYLRITSTLTFEVPR